MARKKARICRTGAARRIGITSKGQVIDMMLTEYNEAKIMEAIKEEAREEGKAQGLAQGRAQGIEEGVATGRTQGETKLAGLIAMMSAQGEFAGIFRVATDPSFCEEMYEKYGIK